MNNLHSILIIAVAAIVTAATRFTPFLIFGENRRIPPIVEYLGKVLPYAIMGMLVIYCLKDVDFLSSPFGLPELLGCAIVACLHIWKRNSLLSIGIGTVCYMILVQVIF